MLVGRTDDPRQRDASDQSRGPPLIGRVWLSGILGVLLVAAYAWRVMTPEPTSTAPPYRAFSDASYWNTPLPANAPVDPDSKAIVKFLKRDNGYNYVRLAGTDFTGRWGNPIYWSGQDDPEYHVINTCSYRPRRGRSPIPHPMRR
jgi:hypothetical protein